MMLRRVLFTLSLFLPLSLTGQSANEWIEFGQTYYRIPIAKNGIYRLGYNELRDSGFPVESVDPANIRLFHRGSEQAIRVEGATDGRFDPGDYVVFYGRKNDGESDSPLYANPADQPHTHFNLFSDTTSFFLTEGPSKGKRMGYQLRGAGAALPEESYHLAERLLLLTDDYGRGASYRDEMYSSAFEAGEGWTSTPLRQGQFRDFVLSSIEKAVVSGPLPRLELTLTGRNAIDHTVEIRVGSTQRVLATLTLSPFSPYYFSEDIQWSDIAAGGKLSVRVSVPSRGYNDQVSVSVIRLTFPQETDASGQAETTWYSTPGQEEKNVVIHNPAPGTEVYDITDPADVFLYETSGPTGVGVTLPPSETGRTLLASTSFIIPVGIKKVVFRRFDSQPHDYVIITHPLLRRPAGNFADPVKAYAGYRASAEGGGFDTLVVNVHQLYDQFNYGEQSPLAIFRFMEFLATRQRPSYLFLVGKGLEYDQKYYRTAGSRTWPQQDLVPTGGLPGSDGAFTMRDGLSFESVPTGRLPAMSAEQVVYYLEKVMETEAQPANDLWKKKILHLSGGIESWEPAAFKGYLESYQAIAEGPYLGGIVNAIAKQSRDVQTINIASEVNEGLGLITFFGHSSTTTLDFDIGYVTDKIMGYKNRGRYPMMLMNGCEVGAFFLRRKLFGEDWILAEKLGATGFIAHNAFAATNNLYNYSHAFYTVAFADSVFIGKGIGDVKREAAKRFIEDASQGISNRSQVEQMILLGDPAMKLFNATKPDLAIRESQLSVVPFGGKGVTALADSFGIRFVVKNYGVVTNQIFRVEVIRTLADNSTISYDSLFPIPRYADTITMVIRRRFEDSAGTNRFRIRLDADDIIEELDESNNEADIELAIPGNSTKNLYPPSFAIVSQPDIRLSFQATNLFAGKRDFVVQLDTVRTFDSPFLKEFTVTGDVLGAQPVALPHTDTLAYYWRTRLASALENESGEWTMSSFTYIADSPEGWAQVHFPQFTENRTEGLSLDNGLRKISFLKTVTPVDIVTFGSASGKPRDSVSVKIAGQEYNLFTQGVGCRLNTINLIAFDRKSTAPYLGVDLKWYEILWQYGGRRLLCGRLPFAINSFTYNETYTGSGKADILEYVDNVADGDSVVLFTIGNANIPLWPGAAKNKVGELGISLQQLSQLTSGEPVIIFARKGAPPGSAKIFRYTGTNPTSARLVVNGAVSGGYSTGSFASTLIGPAASWTRFVHQVADVESHDRVRVEVRGVTFDREEVTIIDDAAKQEDLAQIDAGTYPFLRIVFHTEDDLLLTASQLQNWIVLFTPVAEGVLLPAKGSDQAATLPEGAPLSRTFRFVNIGSRAFPDSLLVRSTVFNHDRLEKQHNTRKIGAPTPGDTTFFNVVTDTRGLPGPNDLEVFVNPRLIAEQYYDNNYVLLRNNIVVLTDQLSPITEVTFDGKFIRNGEYVSPKPVIRIIVRDENPFLMKTDTLGMTIHLTPPCAAEPCATEPIHFTRPDISWSAATKEEPYSVVFHPELSNGRYTLTISSVDAKGNSATTPYSVSFQVEQTPNVFFDHPYPNPFREEVKIGYVVTGGILPSGLGLEILDLTGKPFWRVDKHDGFTTGNNAVYWDGTDLSGAYLPSGVYLYTLRVMLDGKTHRRNGKIVIRR